MPEAAAVARVVLETDNAAEWLCYMAHVGPRPTSRPTLRALHALCVRFDLVADVPRLTPLGLEVANTIVRPI